MRSEAAQKRSGEEGEARRGTQFKTHLSAMSASRLLQEAASERLARRRVLAPPQEDDMIVVSDSEESSVPPPPRPQYVDRLIDDDSSDSDTDSVSMPPPPPPPIANNNEIDPSRLVDVPDEVQTMVVCCICTHVVREPVGHPSVCCHTICRSCMEQDRRSMRDRLKCMQCRKPYRSLPQPVEMVRHLVRGMRIKCRHCPLVHRMNEDASHRAQCPSEPIPCKTCSLTMPRSAMQQHQCPNRKVVCNQCHEEVKASEQKQHERDGPRGKCRGWVECPNKCIKPADETRKRIKTEAGSTQHQQQHQPEEVTLLHKRDLEEHLFALCPLRQVQCDQCDDRFRIDQADEHYRHAKKKHKQVAVQRMNELRDQVKELQQRVVGQQQVQGRSFFDLVPRLYPTYLTMIDTVFQVPVDDLLRQNWSVDTIGLTDDNQLMVSMKMVNQIRHDAKLRLTVSRRDNNVTPRGPHLFVPGDLMVAVGLVKRNSTDIVPGEASHKWRSPYGKDVLLLDTLSLHDIDQNEPEAIWPGNELHIRLALWRKA